MELKKIEEVEREATVDLVKTAGIALKFHIEPQTSDKSLAEVSPRPEGLRSIAVWLG